MNFFSGHRNEPEYWTDEDPFRRGPYLPEIVDIIEQKKVREPQALDVEAALISSAKTFDRETIAKLAAVPAETYYDLICNTRDERQRAIVLSALEFRRIANASDDMRKVISLMEDALRKVAAKSPLNALRVMKYGISVDSAAKFHLAAKPSSAVIS